MGYYFSSPDEAVVMGKMGKSPVMVEDGVGRGARVRADLSPPKPEVLEGTESALCSVEKPHVCCCYCLVL